MTISEIIRDALAVVQPGERVLAIIPDRTRDDNTDLLFPIANQFLTKIGVSRFDALVAQGTHPPMTDAQKRTKIGDEHFAGQIFDHQWNNADEIVTLGELNAETLRSLTDGLIDRAVPVTINRLVGARVYDTVIVFGATVPHEVAGFAGGAKYFFPGVSGPELTHATHWLGALAGIENTIGRVETPTRNLIEAAADFISAHTICFTTVVTRHENDRLRTHALFAGDFRQSLRDAAEVSKVVHIKYTGRRYRRVVAILDEHYDEL